MPLFWIVHEIEGRPVVWIEEANSGIYARLNAAMKGLTGTYKEMHTLDAKNH